MRNLPKDIFSSRKFEDTQPQRAHEAHIDYKCEYYGKYFSQAGNLKTHIHNIHEGHKYFKCESCGKLFSYKGDSKKHINTSMKIRKITCVNIVANYLLEHNL